MGTQALSVSLPSGTIYVSGTVNGDTVIWTNTEGHTWEAVADRATNDIYEVSLTIINSAGTTTSTELTLYYGVLNLITDRTQADVDRVQYLASVGWENMTDAEKEEWSTPLKGAYNASDLNRVGAAVTYISNRLFEYGYFVPVTAKQDWDKTGIPTQADMYLYLQNVRKLKAALDEMGYTPDVPEDMEHLTYQEANDIEKILVDLDFLLNNMVAAWFYAGELCAGEV